MPSNLLTADTSFPNLKSSKSTDEKFGEVSNYLYMLLEQLRYTLGNLGIRILIRQHKYTVICTRCY